MVRKADYRSIDDPITAGSERVLFGYIDIRSMLNASTYRPAYPKLDIVFNGRRFEPAASSYPYPSTIHGNH